MKVWSLGQEDPLEEDMATHASILAWRTPWTEEPGEVTKSSWMPFVGCPQMVILKATPCNCALCFGWGVRKINLPRSLGSLVSPKVLETPGSCKESDKTECTHTPGKDMTTRWQVHRQALSRAAWTAGKVPQAGARWALLSRRRARELRERGSIHV